MNALTLKLKHSLPQRLDMSPFIPAHLAGKQVGEIARIPLWLGNRRVDTGELFAIDGMVTDQIVIQSESDRLDGIGAGMTGGKIMIEGKAGAYLGCGMQNGTILVSGNVGVAAGCAMQGGHLEIAGNAGDFLGGAITGERQGMRGGTIILKGDAGDRAGDLMRRGTILIGGDCGDYCVSRMVAGTMVVMGQCGKQAGMAMRRGTLILTKPPASIPATFNDNGRHHLNFLKLLIQSFKDQPPFSSLAERGNQTHRWLGDLSCGGQGEILICY
ncbi:formylmethanofuran dehydrogenase subunit C [Candidatus Thiodiazotropha sp. LNASS1]|uniref:formylmethanofuran dehydrogenase subunit C n=1 Tax=Candidatus Thiodiazotropha sp. LNASS1 TaxID=3096260 RepID=UPI0034DFBE0C